MKQTLGWEVIISKHTAVYHPQSNLSERVMREIGRIFRAYRHQKHSEWPLYVKKIENWLNSTIYDSTGFTLYELVYGSRPERVLEQLFEYPPGNIRDREWKINLANENLLTKGEKRKQWHDMKGKGIQYEIGDLVLVKTHEQSSALNKEVKKFFLLYTGPYEVIERKMGNPYVLRAPGTQKIVGTHNIVNLRKYWK